MDISSSKFLVVSDYDRTLASEADDFFLKEEVKRRVEEFAKRHLFAVVSGREKRLIDNFARGLKITGWVLENGALIYVGGKEVINAPKSWFERRQEISKILTEMKIPHSVGKVIIYVNNTQPGQLEISSLRDNCDIEFNRGDSMILPKGVNKANGILKLKEILGFNGTVIGVGDGENDAKMMEVVDVKVAVKNAINPIKEMADIVLDYDNGQGIIELLDMIEDGELSGILSRNR